MTGALPIPREGDPADQPTRAAARAPAVPGDRDLLTRAAAGDRAAFGVLVERHHRTLAAILRQKLGSRVPLEDILQEVFARTLAHLDRFRGGASYVTWATSIGLNLAIDQQRKASRRRRLAPSADVDADQVPHPGAARSLELVERRDEARRAREVMEELPTDQRIAVTLRVVEDLPYAEVAQRMGVPVARARTWVSRGLKKLRGALEAEEVSDGR